ncbi:hypothetical protein WA158_007681 [Blastocystis sp. Blastoise]
MCTCWVFSYKVFYYICLFLIFLGCLLGLVGTSNNQLTKSRRVEPFPYLERHLDASLVLTNTSHDKNLLIYYHQDKQIYTIIDLSYSPISDKYTYSLIRNSDNRAFIFDLPQGSYTILKEIPARDRLVTPFNPPPTDPILSTKLKSFVEEYTDKRYYCKPYSFLYKAIETSLYEYMNVLQSLWADIDFGKDFEYLFSMYKLSIYIYILTSLPSLVTICNEIYQDPYDYQKLYINIYIYKLMRSNMKNKIDGITNLTTLFNDLQTVKKSAIYKSLVQYIRDRDILDVLFQQCLNTETLRLSLSLLQYICTVIPLTNKDIDIFYEAVHNSSIYEYIQATTIICQLLPFFPNQQREYLQSLLLNTSVDIFIYINDIPESQPIPDSIRNSIKTVGERETILVSLYIYELNYIPQDMIYTLLTRIEEIIQIARCPSSYIPPHHNSLKEVYSPPFPPPPTTNYFTGAYKDTGNDLMIDNDMEVPEEEEIGLMNTYEEKERGEGEEKPSGELIYGLSHILNTVEIEGEEETGKKKEKEMIDMFTYIGKREEDNDHSIDVQYVYSLRNRLKTADKKIYMI